MSEQVKCQWCKKDKPSGPGMCPHCHRFPTNHDMKEAAEKFAYISLPEIREHDKIQSERQHQKYLDLPDEKKKEIQEDWARHIQKQFHENQDMDQIFFDITKIFAKICRRNETREDKIDCIMMKMAAGGGHTTQMFLTNFSREQLAEKIGSVLDQLGQ